MKDELWQADTYVYVVGFPDRNALKIGLMRDGSKRFEQLAYGCSAPCYVIALFRFPDNVTARTVEAMLMQRHQSDYISNDFFRVNLDWALPRVFHGFVMGECGCTWATHHDGRSDPELEKHGAYAVTGEGMFQASISGRGFWERGPGTPEQPVLPWRSEAIVNGWSKRAKRPPKPQYKPHRRRRIWPCEGQDRLFDE